MVSVFGSGIPNLMLAMSFQGIPGLARMIRAQVLADEHGTGRADGGGKGGDDVLHGEGGGVARDDHRAEGVDGGLDLQVEFDHYLYTKTNRRKIEKKEEPQSKEA